jgi:hypothetical protein
MSRMIASVTASVLLLCLAACVTHDRKMYGQQPWRKQKPEDRSSQIDLPPEMGVAPQTLTQ